MADAAAQQSVEIEADADYDHTGPPKYDIIATPVDYTLEAIHKKLGTLDIILPEFQRKYVWDRHMASRFIESFLIGLPVPPVFLLELRDHRMLVIDGLQRLRTIHGFFNERFGGEMDGQGAKEFRLDGVNEGGRLHGRTFSGMDLGDRRALENAVLRAIIIRQMHPDDNPVVAHDLFERLNTGGMNLKDQEVRHCIYSGKLNDLINELNGIAEWRSLLKSPRQDKRMRDAELVLRYIALLHGGDGYKKPMKAFLSSYMHQNRDPPDAFIREERSRFVRACGILVDRLGALPLNGGNRVNPSVFDAVFVSVASCPDKCDDPGLAERVDGLLSDESFSECTSNAATSTSAVRRRLSLARDRLCR